MQGSGIAAPTAWLRAPEIPVAALVVTLGVSFIAKFFAYCYLVFAGRGEDDRLTPRRLTRWRAMRN